MTHDKAESIGKAWALADDVSADVHHATEAFEVLRALMVGGSIDVDVFNVFAEGVSAQLRQAQAEAGEALDLLHALANSGEPAAPSICEA